MHWGKLGVLMLFGNTCISPASVCKDLLTTGNEGLRDNAFFMSHDGGSEQHAPVFREQSLCADDRSPRSCPEHCRPGSSQSRTGALHSSHLVPACCKLRKWSTCSARALYSQGMADASGTQAMQPASLQQQLLVCSTWRVAVHHQATPALRVPHIHCQARAAAQAGSESYLQARPVEQAPVLVQLLTPMLLAQHASHSVCICPAAMHLLPSQRPACHARQS